MSIYKLARKQVLLGESILAERREERKTKTKTYGSQGVLWVLTVGFRTVLLGFHI